MTAEREAFLEGALERASVLASESQLEVGLLREALKLHARALDSARRAYWSGLVAALLVGFSVRGFLPW